MINVFHALSLFIIFNFVKRFCSRWQERKVRISFVGKESSIIQTLKGHSVEGKGSATINWLIPERSDR